MNNTHFCEHVQVGDQIVLSALARDAAPRIAKAVVIRVDSPPTWTLKQAKAVKISYLTSVNGVEVQLSAIIHREPKGCQPLAVIVKKATQEGTQCPGCGASIPYDLMNRHYNGVRGTYICPRCDGVLGRIHITQLLKVADLDAWHDPAIDGPEEVEDWRYFDLELDSQSGRRRFHGWFHRRSTKLLQTG